MIRTEHGGGVHVREIATAAEPILPKGSGVSLLAHAIEGEGAAASLTSIRGVTTTPSVISDLFSKTITALGKTPGPPSVTQIPGGEVFDVVVPVLPSAQ